PEANPDAEPQSYTNNAPFSGAIYIVDPNGQQITTQNTKLCPNSASVSCGDINRWGWCCPNAYTCVSPGNSNGLIGCCPSGNTCGGAVAAAASTVTVNVQQTQTQNTVYVQQTQQPTQNTVPQATVFAGYCSTLTMSGPGLPTTRQGECGTILVVNEARRHLQAIGYGVGGILLLLHLALGRMF
ncbi:hypothetical protein CC80DRAFT_379910, partial [Byssothecium circinans]